MLGSVALPIIDDEVVFDLEIEVLQMILGVRPLEQGPNSQPAIGDCDVVITPKRLPAALLSDSFGFPQPLSKPMARILREDAEFWVRDRGRHDGS